MRFFSVLAAALPIVGSLAAAVPYQDEDVDVAADGDIDAQLETRNYWSPKCNVAGYNQGQTKAFKVIMQKCTAKQCSNYCKRKTKCKSFAVGKDRCKLYAAPVSRSCQPKRHSPFKFYDRACKIKQKPKQATTKKTTTTTAKSAPATTNDGASTSQAGATSAQSASEETTTAVQEDPATPVSSTMPLASSTASSLSAASAASSNEDQTTGASAIGGSTSVTNQNQGPSTSAGNAPATTGTSQGATNPGAASSSTSAMDQDQGGSTSGNSNAPATTSSSQNTADTESNTSASAFSASSSVSTSSAMGASAATNSASTTLAGSAAGASTSSASASTTSAVNPIAQGAPFMLKAFGGPASVPAGANGAVQNDNSFTFNANNVPSTLSVSANGALTDASGKVASIVRNTKSRVKRQSQAGSQISFTLVNELGGSTVACVCGFDASNVLSCSCDGITGFVLNGSGVLGIGEIDGFQSFTPQAIAVDETSSSTATASTAVGAVGDAATVAPADSASTTTAADANVPDSITTNIAAGASTTSDDAAPSTINVNTPVETEIAASTTVSTMVDMPDDSTSTTAFPDQATTPTTTAAATTTTPLRQCPATIVCGARGRPANTLVSRNTLNFYSDGNSNTRDGCRAKCESTTGCGSFLISTSPVTSCALLSVDSLDAAGFDQAATNAFQDGYDMACFNEPACPSAVATATEQVSASIQQQTTIITGIPPTTTSSKSPSTTSTNALPMVNFLANWGFEFPDTLIYWSKKIETDRSDVVQLDTQPHLGHSQVALKSYQAYGQGGKAGTATLQQTLFANVPTINYGQMSYFYDLSDIPASTICTLTTKVGGNVVKTRTFTSADTTGKWNVPDVVDGLSIGPGTILQFDYLCDVPSGSTNLGSSLFLDDIFLGSPGDHVFAADVPAATADAATSTNDDAAVTSTAEANTSVSDLDTATSSTTATDPTITEAPRGPGCANPTRTEITQGNIATAYDMCRAHFIPSSNPNDAFHQFDGSAGDCAARCTGSCVAFNYLVDQRTTDCQTMAAISTVRENEYSYDGYSKVSTRTLNPGEVVVTTASITTTTDLNTATSSAETPATSTTSTEDASISTDTSSPDAVINQSASSTIEEAFPATSSANTSTTGAVTDAASATNGATGSTTAGVARPTMEIEILDYEHDYVSVGKVASVHGYFGEFMVSTAGSVEALQISYEIPEQQFQDQVSVRLENTGLDRSLLFLSGMVPNKDQRSSQTSSNLASGSPNIAYIGQSLATSPGSPPTVVDSSYNGLYHNNQPAESAIWKLDTQNQLLAAQWININGFTPQSPSTSIAWIHMSNVNSLVLTGDLAALRASHVASGGNAADVVGVVFHLVNVPTAAPTSGGGTDNGGDEGVSNGGVNDCGPNCVETM